MINPIELSPFQRFCVTLGAMPTSYKVSLTYEEQLMWLCNYLENTVIPAIDNNAEALREVQTLFTQLTNYVDHYFDNLDVQEEINNKLDEMAEDGTLANLINQELEDILDDVTTDITNIKERLDLLESDKIVAIGDSYATGSSAGQQFAVDGWTERLRSLLGMSTSNFQWYGEGGAGLISKGHDNHNFLELLQYHINDITDKDKVKYFILAGGYNDQSQTKDNLWSALQSFVNYVKVQFPNAKILVGMIGNNSALTSAGLSTRRNLRETVLFAYKRCINFGASYMTGVENVLHNYDLMSTDYIHPTEVGYKEIAYAMYQVLTLGFHEPYYGFQSSSVTGDNVSATNLDLQTKLYGNTTIMTVTGYVNFTNPVSVSSPDTEIELGDLTNMKFFRRSTDQALFCTPVILTKADTTRIATMGTVRITYDGKLKITLMNTDTTLSITRISFYRGTHIINNNFC